MDALPFLPANNTLVLNVKSLFGIVRKLIRPMCAEAQAIFMIDNALVPLEAKLFPIIKPLLHFTRMHEELQVPLLELALAEQEVPRRDFVAESLPNLAD